MSADPAVPPAIDPHYYEEELDLDILVEGFKYIRKLCQMEPFKDYIVAEALPGFEVSTDEQIRGAYATLAT